MNSNITNYRNGKVYVMIGTARDTYRWDMVMHKTWLYHNGTNIVQYNADVGASIDISTIVDTTVTANSSNLVTSGAVAAAINAAIGAMLVGSY